MTAVTNFGPVPRAYEDGVDDAVLDEDVWDNPFLHQLKNRARMHMADQGDGNHFAYIGEMEVTPEFLALLRLTRHTELAENLAPSVSKTLRVLVTHHGSRSIGAHLYKRGQNAAEKHTAKVAEGIPKASAWLDARWFSGVPDLSETPVAYKNAAEVKRQIADFGLAEVIAEIRPLGCIMAGHIDQPWRRRKDVLSPKQLRQIEHRAERRKVRQQLE